MANSASAEMFAKMLETQMLHTANLMDQKLDAENIKLDKIDDDELELLNERRLATLRKAQQQKQDWLSKGHGEYREISSEKDFFPEVKESKNVVCHFYKETTFRCKILDKHLAILAKKHVETKFIKLNVEKAPFLTERLRIKVIPTLALVKDGNTKDYVVGFTDLGNTDDFTTEILQWRLGCADIINYRETFSEYRGFSFWENELQFIGLGNILEPPTQGQKKYGTNFTKLEKKSIRGKAYDSDSD